jgi:ketosteroid isomerase-like protein
MKFGTLALALTVACLAVTSIAQDKMKGAGTMRAKPQLAPKAMSVAEWQKGYNEAAKAFERKDANAIMAYMAPGFTMTMNGKTRNAAEAKKGLQEWFGMMKNLHCKMTVTSAKHNGGVAVVTDNFRNWGMTMPDPKTKKSGKLVDTGTEKATWVWLNGKWMMKTIVTINEKITIDGKPVKM